MVRGKKVMHLFDKPAFDYLPGETVIVPANETMVIDFPEAEINNPTQCIALAVDGRYVNNTLNYLDSYYNNDPDDSHNWKLQFNQYHFANDTEITGIINKLIRVCSSADTAKNIYADLNYYIANRELLKFKFPGEVIRDEKGKITHLKF